MILGTGCLGDLALDGDAIRAALAAVRLDQVLLVAAPGTQARSLSGLSAPAVRVGWDDVNHGVSVAAAAGSRTLVVSLPDDADLDDACRGIHSLSRSTPGLTIAVLTPSTGPLAVPRTLRLLFEDLAALEVRYWHRPSLAFLAGEAPVETWLDELSRWLSGISLDDVADGEAGLPPGLGQLDLRQLAALSARAIPVALDVDPIPDVALLRMTIDTLITAGFS